MPNLEPDAAGEPGLLDTQANVPTAVAIPEVNFIWQSDDGTEVTVVDGLIDAEFLTDHDFGIGSTEFRPEVLPKVRRMAAFLRTNPGVDTLRIEAFAGQRCNSGPTFDRARLRAHRIARALVAQGIDCKRLEAVGCVADDASMRMRFEARVVRFDGNVLAPALADGQPSRRADPCAPTPAPTGGVAPPSASAASVAPTAKAEKLWCRCGVVGFESNRPPDGRCNLDIEADGSAKLDGSRSKPRFLARLKPKPRKPGEKVYYAFDGTFDFHCQEAWCGRQNLSVLAVAEHDYRVTVARSDDGPPSHVLWATCYRPVPATWAK